jgi:hypothetical protein
MLNVILQQYQEIPKRGESFKAGIFTTGILLLQPEQFTVEQSKQWSVIDTRFSNDIVAMTVY